MANDGNDDVRKTRSGAKCDRSFQDAEGGFHGRVFDGVQAVRFRFIDSGQELHMPLDDLPEGILRAAAAFGINTSVGNTFGAISDPDEAIEVAEARWEQLKSGTWSAERTTGPRIGDLVEAMVRFYREAGHPRSEEEIRAKLSNPAVAKAVAAEPQIAVHVAAIRKERAEERARDAQSKTNGKPSVLDSLF